MTRRYGVPAFMLLAAAALPALAAEPSELQLSEAVRLGTVATLAPLCGLRDDAWAADLRRATVQSTTGTTAHDDAALRAAPGSNMAVSALSFADAEALEDFAESPPEKTCAPLAHGTGLAQADSIVRAFRDQGPRAPGS